MKRPRKPSKAVLADIARRGGALQAVADVRRHLMTLDAATPRLGWEGFDEDYMADDPKEFETPGDFEFNLYLNDTLLVPVKPGPISAIEFFPPFVAHLRQEADRLIEAAETILAFLPADVVRACRRHKIELQTDREQREEREKEVEAGK